MRHRRSTTKLGRKTKHRLSLISNQVCSLILNERIKTTLAKAKAVRPEAEKMVTLGKRGDLHSRRNAASFLKLDTAVKRLFDEIAPRCETRQGGYTRIVKLGPRKSDSAPMALLEWVDAPGVVEQAEPEVTEAAPKKKATSKSAKAKPAAESDAPEEAAEK